MQGEENTYIFPHVKSALSTGNAMRMVIVALIPSAVTAIYCFGTKACFQMLACVTAGMLTEFTIEAFAGLPLEAGDFSSAVTGLMLALMLPYQAPLWAGAAATVFAVAVVKMLLGGWLKVRLNPALCGYVVLLWIFPGFMRDFSFGDYGSSTLLGSYLAGETVDPLPMILGNTNGGMGMTSAAAVALGAVILLAAGVIRFRIPALATAAFALTVLISGGFSSDAAGLVTQLCGGGLLFIFWFMAVDYSSSPVTPGGQILYAVVIGVLAGVLRYAGIEEAAVYAVLAGNLLVPVFERLTVPKPFGTSGGKGMRTL